MLNTLGKFSRDRFPKMSSGMETARMRWLQDWQNLFVHSSHFLWEVEKQTRKLGFASKLAELQAPCVTLAMSLAKHTFII
jgi:hypothetical protein